MLTLQKPQTTCSDCPNWQPSPRTNNVGLCSQYDQRTFGHDKAGPNCPTNTSPNTSAPFELPQVDLNNTIAIEQPNPTGELWVGEIYINQGGYAKNLKYVRLFAADQEYAEAEVEQWLTLQQSQGQFERYILGNTWRP